MCSKREAPRLTSKRACTESGQIPPHDVSRHADFGDTLLTHPHLPGKFPFTQGTIFPSHVRPGDIKEISEMVEDEFQRYKRNRANRVVAVQPVDGASRINVKIERYGVKEVGAFMRGGEAVSVFPEEGYKPLELKRGKKGKKARKILGS